MSHVKNLHFEVCYWSAIEYCIDNGLSKMEPGASGGDYKFARGFDPSIIHSTHFFSNPGLDNAVRQFIEMERLNNLESTEYLKLNSRVKNNNSNFTTTSYPKNKVGNGRSSSK
jgi:predicted N-acyltransferase